MKKNLIYGSLLLAVLVGLAACDRPDPSNSADPSHTGASSSLTGGLTPTYDPSGFYLDGYRMTYGDSDSFETRLGIDVSEHNGVIDWVRVAENYQFAFLRIGYTGYGEEGSLNEDPMFETNYEEARAAGLDLGVYYFSQARTEEEAEKEAAFVVDLLGGRELELPVTYDVETIDHDVARTDSVTGEQFTENARVFAGTVAKAGYRPCIYTNLVWQTTKLSMEELADLSIWFSGYTAVPESPYRFDFWQYSDSGIVDGIEGPVDLNIEMIEK